MEAYEIIDETTANIRNIQIVEVVLQEENGQMDFIAVDPDLEDEHENSTSVLRMKLRDGSASIQQVQDEEEDTAQVINENNVEYDDDDDDDCEREGVVVWKYCVNCSDPFLQQQKYQSQDDNVQHKENAEDLTNLQQKQQQQQQQVFEIIIPYDVDSLVKGNETVSSTTKTKTVKVQNILSSIYKLDYLNMVLENLDSPLLSSSLLSKYMNDKDNFLQLHEDIPICEKCSLSLTSLYKFYNEFNSLRQVDSYLGKRISKLDDIIEDLVFHALSSSIKNKKTNNRKNVVGEKKRGRKKKSILTVKNPKTKQQQQQQQQKSSNNQNSSGKNSRDKVQSNHDSFPIVSGPFVKLQRLENTPDVGVSPATTSENSMNQEHNTRRCNKKQEHPDSVDNDIGEPEFGPLSEHDDNIEDECTLKNEEPIVKVENEGIYSDTSGPRRSQRKKRKSRKASPSPPRTTVKKRKNNNVENVVTIDSNTAASDKTSSTSKVQFRPKSIKKSFTCPQCSLACTTAQMLKIHMRRHNKGNDVKPYECDVKSCNKKFDKPSRLIAHQKRWHTVTEQEDGEDGQVSDSQDPSGNFYACPKCPMMFKSEMTKDAHVLRTHEGCARPYKCRTCDKSYRHKIHLDEHLHLHLNCQYPCTECNKEFLSERKLRVHMANVHSSGDQNRPYKCEHCPKSFVKVYLLESHMFKHTGQKKFMCEVCGHSYSSNKRLRVHLQRHANGVEMKEPFQCDQCSKVFSEPQSLHSHIMSIHEKKFRFHCEVCGIGCQMLSMLKRHMLCHTEEKSFSCEVEGCDKKFKRKPQLVQHMLIHEGKNPFVCQACGKGFRASEKLKNHMKLHTGEKPFKCHFDKCTKQFALKHYLTNHINTSHKGMKQQKKPKDEASTRKGHSTTRVKVFDKMEPKEESMISHPPPPPIETVEIQVFQTSDTGDLSEKSQSQPHQSQTPQIVVIPTSSSTEDVGSGSGPTTTFTVTIPNPQSTGEMVTTGNYEWLQFGYLHPVPTDNLTHDPLTIETKQTVISGETNFTSQSS